MNFKVITVILFTEILFPISEMASHTNKEVFHTPPYRNSCLRHADKGGRFQLAKNKGQLGRHKHSYWMFAALVRLMFTGAVSGMYAVKTVTMQYLFDYM